MLRASSVVCVSGWCSMWCRKLTENKTVVGGEKKGRERKRERDKEGTFIYRPGHRCRSTEDRRSLIGWREILIGVLLTGLDECWTICGATVCFSLVYIVRPSTTNVTMDTNGCDRVELTDITHTHLIAEIPVPCCFSLPASSLCFLARVASHLYY